MKKLLAATFTLFLACSTSSSDSDEPSGIADSPGLIAYMRWAEGEEIPSELVIADEDGEVRHTVDVEGGLGLVPTRASNVLLVRGGQGSAITHVVDAAEGEARAVEGTEDLAPFAPQPLIQGRRYMVLISPQGDRVALLDLEQAQVIDLAETLGDFNFVAGAHVSPDDRFVAISTTEGLWLIPTDSPSEGTRLSEESTPFIGGFAEDGTTLVFTAYSSDGAEVVSVSVDGGSTESLASGDAPLNAVVSPGGQDVLLLRPDSVARVSSKGGEVEEVVGLSGPSRFAHFSESGDRLLVATGDQDLTFELVDLEGKESQKLDELSGLRPIPLTGQTAQRWMLFSEEPESGGLLGRETMALDLEEGTVEPVLLLEGSDFANVQSWSPDGRFGVVVSFTDSESTLYLVDLDKGESRQLAKGNVTSGAVSYDGNLVVVAEGRESPQDTKLFTVPVEGGERSEIGTGLSPIWVRP